MDTIETARTKFDEVTERFAKIRFMNQRRASIIRDLIVENDARDILEIGFLYGKSSAYIAAILQDLGRGSLVTIDLQSAQAHSPNIHDLLRATGLEHRVQPIFAFRSFTWELQKMLAQAPRPRFDLCYFDGGHTWDNTGFGVVLVDLLLKPGGLLVLDDMNWRLRTSRGYKRRPKKMARYSDDELDTPTVRRTWDLILPHLGYTEMWELPEVRWGVARKPAADERASAAAP